MCFSYLEALNKDLAYVLLLSFEELGVSVMLIHT